LAAAKEQVTTLTARNEELAQQHDKKSENSSADNNNNHSALSEENAQLKAQTQELNNSIDELKEEISNLKASHEKALEAEFEKLADAQKEIRSLQDKVEELGKPKPITGPKVTSQPSPVQQQPQQQAISPRGDKDGNIPAWKQREMDRAREAEQARQAEAQRKLQKVASIRLTGNDIHHDETTGNRNFKDPLENKAPVVSAVEDKPESAASGVNEFTDEEKAAAEMARLGKTLKRGGHNI